MVSVDKKDRNFQQHQKICKTETNNNEVTANTDCVKPDEKNFTLEQFLTMPYFDQIQMIRLFPHMPTMEIQKYTTDTRIIRDGVGTENFVQ